MAMPLSYTPSSVPKGERDEEITLDFKTIGDHSIIGLLQYKNLLIPNRIINRHVTVNAEECWSSAFSRNLDHLLVLKPASIKINIRKFL